MGLFKKAKRAIRKVKTGVGKVGKGVGKVGKGVLGSQLGQQAAVGLGTSFGGPTGGLLAGSLAQTLGGGTRMASQQPNNLIASGPVSAFPVFTASAAVPFGETARAAVGSLGPTLSNILLKISSVVGRNITFRAAMIIIRRLMKMLQSPQAVAAAVGLSVGELAQMFTASAVIRSSGRRMNVGNVKALKRAHRRIQGFHKICKTNDELAAPRRRTTRKVINVTPCR